MPRPVLQWASAWNLEAARAWRKNSHFGEMCVAMQIENADEFDIEHCEVQYFMPVTKYSDCAQSHYLPTAVLLYS
jgi:hypothetical protein